MQSPVATSLLTGVDQLVAAVRKQTAEDVAQSSAPGTGPDGQRRLVGRTGGPVDHHLRAAGYVAAEAVELNAQVHRAGRKVSTVRAFPAERSTMLKLSGGCQGWGLLLPPNEGAHCSNQPPRPTAL